MPGLLTKILSHPVAANTIGSAGTAFGMDWLQHPSVKVPVVDSVKDMVDGNFDKFRAGNMGLNALIGAAGLGLMRQGYINPLHAERIPAGAGLIALAPAKDLILNLQATPRKINEALDSTQGIQEGIAKATEASQNTSKNMNMLLGILGAGALATGAVATGKYLTRKDPKADMGTLKLKLPGKKGDPNTSAEVELPIDMPGMSPNLIEGLNRGVRLQARRNVRANSFKRDPQTGKLIPYEDWAQHQRDAQQGMPQTADPYSANLNKAASTRDWAEGAGSVLTAGGSGLLGTLGGASLAARVGINPLIGGVAGGLTAGAVPLIAGSVLGAITGNRTQQDQAAHDSSSAFGEYFIPGYAAYQQERRKRVQTAAEQAIAQNSFANTGMAPAGVTGLNPDVDIDDYMDDPELDKYAGIQPPVPQPRPQNVQSRRPVGNTIPPAPGLAPAAANAGAPPTGGLQGAAGRLTSVAQELDDMQAKQAFYITYTPLPPDGVKSAADLSARGEVQTIMDRIYNEDPSYWPYGLGIPGHEGVYLVRDSLTKQAAGFVGWQEGYDHGRKVGSYSIGILPEYRGNGFAKEAVAKILREKSASVDEVRSYVMSHNLKSKGLAASLGVPVQESF